MYRKKAANLVNVGYIAFMAAGMVLPLLLQQKREKERGLRSLEAVGTALLIGQGLKRLVPEERPDGRDLTSFPSGHAAYSFAVAAVNSAYAPKQSPFWLLGAFLISLARVRLHRHHWWDVVFGGALGVGAACFRLVSKNRVGSRL